MLPLSKLLVLMNRKLLSLLLIVACPLLSAGQKAQLQAGNILAKPCLECHASPGATLGGPLKGIRMIRSSAYIYSLLKNPMQFADENKTAKKAFAKRGLQMPPFPDLSKADIKAILDYFDKLPISN